MARLVLQPLDLLLLVALVLPLSWLMGGLGGLLVGWELPLALPCAALVAAVGVLVTLGKALRLSERLLGASPAAVSPYLRRLLHRGGTVDGPAVDTAPREPAVVPEH